MSKSSSKRITGLLFVFVVSVALACADLVVSARNEDTQEDITRGGQMASNTTTGNVSSGNSGRRGRRGRRRSGAMTNSTTAAVGGEQTDLSGTYTGTVDYPEGGLSSPATLTITGNNFTLMPEGGGAPVSGRVTAVTTHGYTGVTLMFGDTTPPPAGQSPPPLPAVSLRVRRVGSSVTLTSVPGEKRKFSFRGQPDCPPYPRCLPILSCRPCER